MDFLRSHRILCSAVAALMVAVLVVYSYGSFRSYAAAPEVSTLLADNIGAEVNYDADSITLNYNGNTYVFNRHMSFDELISDLEPVDELDSSLLYKVQHINGSNYLYWYVSSNNRYKVDVRKVIYIYTTNAIESLNSTYRKLNRQRSVFPSDTALLKALYLATFEATKKWTMSIRNWGQVYGKLSIMYEGRLPE